MLAAMRCASDSFEGNDELPPGEIQCMGGSSSYGGSLLSKMSLSSSVVVSQHRSTTLGLPGTAAAGGIAGNVLGAMQSGSDLDCGGDEGCL